MPARRKRQLESATEIDGFKVRWELQSEPQLSSNGYGGVTIKVSRTDGNFRELVLEYPFPQKGRKMLIDGRYYSVSPAFPIRPAISPKAVEADIRLAMEAGWDPASRGKPFRFQVHTPKSN